MFIKSEFPEDWKHSFVCMIDKSDKNSVRPIALTSCLCKIFEALLKNRMIWWVEHHNILPKCQSGFRIGKSCSDNLTYLVLQLDEAMSRKKDVCAAFLDVSDAFNNVITDILLEKLATIGCSAQTIKFIKFLTYERFIHTDIEEYEIVTVNKGVPRRGVEPTPLSHIRM